MTARQIYDQDIRSLPAMERLRLARLILDELRQSPEAQDEVWAEEIRKATIPNEQLLELAKAHQPPQSWWDDSDAPFSAGKGS